MLDRSGVVIGDWVEKSWRTPDMVCIDTACALAEADVVEAGVRAGGLREASLLTVIGMSQVGVR